MQLIPTYFVSVWRPIDSKAVLQWEPLVRAASVDHGETDANLDRGKTRGLGEHFLFYPSYSLSLFLFLLKIALIVLQYVA